MEPPTRLLFLRDDPRDLPRRFLLQAGRGKCHVRRGPRRRGDRAGLLLLHPDPVSVVQRYRLPAFNRLGQRPEPVRGRPEAGLRKTVIASPRRGRSNLVPKGHCEEPGDEAIAWVDTIAALPTVARNDHRSCHPEALPRDLPASQA